MAPPLVKMARAASLLLSAGLRATILISSLVTPIDVAPPLLPTNLFTHGGA